MTVTGEPGLTGESVEAPEPALTKRPAGSRLVGTAHRQPPPVHLLACVAIVAALVVANLPVLLGLADLDPISSFSSLAVHVQPGPLAGGWTIDPNAGFTSQALGHRAALDVLAGRAPWWNPFEGVGTPLAAGMQAAALFPPTLLLALPHGTMWFFLLLEVVAAIATYFLARRLGVRPVFAAAAGVAFALCGTNAWFRYAAANPVPFLPLLLLGLERCRDAKHRSGPALVAVALALSLYAGFPETALLDGVLAVGWLGWRLVGTPAARGALLVRTGLGGLGGLLLAAPALLPFLSFAATAYAGNHGTGAFAGVHLPTRSLPALLLPYVFGPIAHPTTSLVLPDFWGSVGGYASTGLLLLALLGLVRVRGGPHRGLRVLLAGWVAVALARTYGLPVVTGLVDAIPGADAIALYRYLPPSWELALVLLAALGVEDVAAGRLRRRSVLAAAGVAAVTVGAAVLVARPVLRATLVGDRELVLFAWASVTASVVVLLVLAGGLLVAYRRAGQALLATVVALEAMALFVVPQLSAPRRVQLDLGTVAFLQQAAGTGRLFSFGPLQANYGSYWGLPQLDVNDALIPERFAEVIERQLDPEANPQLFIGGEVGRPRGAATATEAFALYAEAYRELGLTQVVVAPGVPAPTAGLTLVHRGEAAWVYRLDDPLPFAAAPGCQLILRSRTQIEASCPATSALLRRELFAPGWSATVGGRPAPVREAARLFQLVDLPPGRSVVRFAYAPPGETLALAAAGMGIVLLLLPAAAGRRRTRGTRSSATPNAPATSAASRCGGA